MSRAFIIFDNKLINPDHIIHISLIQKYTQAGIEVQCIDEYHTKYYDNECDRNQEFNELVDILCNK